MRLKRDIKRFVECLNAGVAGYQFSFYVISAAPRAVVQSALEEVAGWDAARIRQLVASQGLVSQEWDKARTDWVTLRACPEAGAGVVR